MKRTFLKIAALFTVLGIVLSQNCVTANAKESFINESELQQITLRTGKAYDIDPCLLYAICEKESSLNIYAENGRCQGLMQVSERWHKTRMEKLGVESLFDPEGNVLVATDYISDLISENSDIAYVLMRYNMAISTADELYGKGVITDYARSVIERQADLHDAGFCGCEVRPVQKQQTEVEINSTVFLDNSGLEIADDIMPKGGVAAVIDVTFQRKY